jgi:hypothetical protein
LSDHSFGVRVVVRAAFPEINFWTFSAQAIRLDFVGSWPAPEAVLLSSMLRKEDLRVYAGVNVHRRDIERVAEHVGEQVDQWMARENRIASEQPQHGIAIPILYVSLDGTGVPVRKSEVEGRRGKGDDGKAKTREVKSGCVFTQTSVDDDGYAVRDEDSTSYVGAIEYSKLFGQRLLFEAIRRGLNRARKIVALSDGAAYNKTIIQELSPRIIHIIDIYHAREHLHELLKALDVPKEKRSKWLSLDYSRVFVARVLRWRETKVFEQIDPAGIAIAIPRTAIKRNPWYRVICVLAAGNA